jgi:DNA-binding transcriptional MerR regulator/methylmalonyl-CoA mutase cobalamin-binding subunit
MDRNDAPDRSRPRPAAAEPVYNIKAMAQRTGVPADTVRAWERRYGIPRPERTPGGQRLYSERDLAVISWLRERTEEGMTISQAISLLEAVGAERIAAAPASEVAAGPRPPAAIASDLIAAFARYDQAAAEQYVQEAIALFGVETTFLHVIRPALVEIGERWHRAEVTATVEHFATEFVTRKLAGLIGMYDSRHAPWTVVIGCAANERHEVGALLLALFMVRQGWRVLYLGADVPIADLLSTVRRVQPDMVCLSAMGAEAAANIAQVGNALHELEEPRPIFAFGGQIFNLVPELRASVPGVFLGEDAAQAVNTARTLLIAR